MSFLNRVCLGVCACVRDPNRETRTDRTRPPLAGALERVHNSMIIVIYAPKTAIHTNVRINLNVLFHTRKTA